MRARVYIKAGKGRNGKKVAAAVRPSYEPLRETVDGIQKAVPTVFFAVDVEIRDDLLKRAERAIASITVQENEIALIPLVASDLTVEEANDG